MSQIFLEPEEIQDIFKSHLKIESKVMGIETLFANLRIQNKIIYAPYYQRNYVWDNDKATYFVESILLGTEIPPLVFFNSGSSIEVIDGRQRFETIKRFIDKQFHLTSKGLNILKDLSKKNFDDLSTEIQDFFWDTKLRIIEFSVIDESKLDEKNEDLIKKEIFRRYNSGITPLRTEEIDKAIYINDDTTSYFKYQFKQNKSDYEVLLELFFLDRDIELKDKPLTLEKVMQKIRLLLVLHNIPINYYSTLKGRKDIIGKLFENLSNNSDSAGEIPQVYKDFMKKVYYVKEMKDHFVNTKRYSNRLVYECLLWALNIIDTEGIKLDLTYDTSFKNRFVEYIASNIDKFGTENSHFYKEFIGRYLCISKFFEAEFDIKFDLYLSNYGQFREKLDEIACTAWNTSELTQFQTLRLNKTDASTTTIEDICRQMMRQRFIVRPSYQRGESINKAKSSALIESILLGIKLPPIFVYKRNDGISEVVDGQQRLLAILGYIGQPFLDENFKTMKSEKNKYSLSKLRILTELEGKKFEDLSNDLKDKIYDFNLSIVTIDSKVNPHFDPIDLFIRLNYKPYPIRENTFEMWNSYVDKDIISITRDIARKYSEWFYSRINNNRMENEELIISLAYLEYERLSSIRDNKNVHKYLDIYQKKNKINYRIKDKDSITKVLNTVTLNESYKSDFIKSIKSVESFIKNVKTMLIDKDTDDINGYLKRELDKIFSVQGKSDSTRRTLQSFYALWYTLKDINFEMLKYNRTQIKREVGEFFAFMKNIPEEYNDVAVIDIFTEKIAEFWNKYRVSDRAITLTNEEKQNLIKSQNNICPICRGKIFAGDEIHVDHISPLATGGRDSFLNLQITHKQCNLKKGTRHV